MGLKPSCPQHLNRLLCHSPASYNLKVLCHLLAQLCGGFLHTFVHGSSLCDGGRGLAVFWFSKYCFVHLITLVASLYVDSNYANTKKIQTYYDSFK